jgi:hypothetical protein
MKTITAAAAATATLVIADMIFLRLEIDVER